MSSSADLIASIWAEHRPTMSARLDVLDRAADELRSGQLDPALVAEAADAAHKLAGSVGSFGYGRSSLMARRAEKILRAGATNEPGEASVDIAALVADMRTEMGFEATVAELTDDATPSATMTLPLITLAASDLEALNDLRVEAGKLGLRAVSVIDLARVVDRVARDRPAAVLIDLHCDGSDLAPPLDLVAELTAAYPALPVVVTGGDGSPAERDAYARAGAAGYVSGKASAWDQLDRVTLVLAELPRADERVLAVTADATLAPEIAAPDELWDALERVQPSLIVLDARTTGLDATATCSALRAERRWSLTPIVVVDGEPGVFEAGADDCVPTTALHTLPALIATRIARTRAHTSLATTDALTGLATRHAATTALADLLELTGRMRRRLCLTLIDLDHSSRLAAAHSSAAPDEALRRLAGLLKRDLGPDTVAARWGRDQLLVATFNLDCDRGIDRASELLNTWRDEPFAFGSQTFSAGVAEFPTDGEDAESLLASADRALRAAKDGGRDLVVGSSGAHRTTQQVDVAIVEDEELASELMSEGLERRGLRCWRFSNGASAVQMLAGERPRVRAKVILLDLNLPAVDGMELLTLLGRDGVLRSTRVIVVSANDFPQVIQQARDLGASDYLVKPITVDDLARRVDRALAPAPA